MLFTTATVAKLPPGCDGQPVILEEAIGHFSSPGYSSESNATYANNLSCAWLITVEPESVRIIISFQHKQFETQLLDHDHSRLWACAVSLWQWTLTWQYTSRWSQILGSTLYHWHWVTKRRLQLSSTGFVVEIKKSWIYQTVNWVFTGLLWMTVTVKYKTADVLHQLSSFVRQILLTIFFLLKKSIQRVWCELFQKVFLRFEEFFIESPYSGNMCFDAVRVFDGDNATTYRPVGVYCGTKTPSDFLSSSNKVLVTFESDSSTTHRGFVAIYSTKRSTARSVNGQPTSVWYISINNLFSSD